MAKLVSSHRWLTSWSVLRRRVLGHCFHFQSVWWRSRPRSACCRPPCRPPAPPDLPIEGGTRGCAIWWRGGARRVRTGRAPRTPWNIDNYYESMPLWANYLKSHITRNSNLEKGRLPPWRIRIYRDNNGFAAKRRDVSCCKKWQARQKEHFGQLGRHARIYSLASGKTILGRKVGLWEQAQIIDALLLISTRSKWP